MKMVKRVAISAGHSTNPKRDMGASSKDGKYVEGLLTAEARVLLVKGMIEAAKVEGITDIQSRIITDSDDTTLADSLKVFTGNTDKDTLCIDIHFNAANGIAKGTEVLIPDNPTGVELEIADRISDLMSIHLGTPERGVIGKADGVKTESQSHRGKLGWMRLAGQNILLEVEFLDNKEAMKVYDKKKFEMWNDIAKYIVGILIK